MIMKSGIDLRSLVRSGVFLQAAGAGICSGSFAMSLRFLDPDLSFLSRINPDLVVFNVFIVFASLVATFRTSHAVMRFTEAAALMHKLSACWYDAASTLVCFCRPSPKQDEGAHFQEVLVRLVSLMNALIFDDLENKGACIQKNKHIFEVLGWNDLSDEIQDGVMHANCKVEFVFHCIQQLVIDGMESQVLAVPPPILTRSFQELGAGILNYHEAKKLSHVPLPFPYRFITLTILLGQAMFMPFIMAMYTAGISSSFSITFSGTFMLWFLNGVAESLNNPFQKAASTLNTAKVQVDLNRMLKELLRQSHGSTPSLRKENQTSLQQGNRVTCMASTMTDVNKEYTRKMTQRAFFSRCVSVDSSSFLSQRDSETVLSETLFEQAEEEESAAKEEKQESQVMLQNDNSVGSLSEDAGGAPSVKDQSAQIESTSLAAQEQADPSRPHSPLVFPSGAGGPPSAHVGVTREGTGQQGTDRGCIDQSSAGRGGAGRGRAGRGGAGVDRGADVRIGHSDAKVCTTVL